MGMFGNLGRLLTGQSGATLSAADLARLLGLQPPPTADAAQPGADPSTSQAPVLFQPARLSAYHTHGVGPAPGIVQAWSMAPSQAPADDTDQAGLDQNGLDQAGTQPQLILLADGSLQTGGGDEPDNLGDQNGLDAADDQGGLYDQVDQSHQDEQDGLAGLDDTGDDSDQPAPNSFDDLNRGYALDDLVARSNDSQPELTLAAGSAQPDTLMGGAGQDRLTGKARIHPKMTPAQAAYEFRHVSPAQSYSPQARALLDTFAAGESRGHPHNGYGALYGYHDLPSGRDGQPDYTQFPNKGPAVQGRYQIKPDTWNAAVYPHPELAEKTPANQDQVAWMVARAKYNHSTGRDLNADLLEPNRYPQIVGALKSTWASLPGTNQSNGQTMAVFTQRMGEGIKRYSPAPAPR